MRYEWVRLCVDVWKRSERWCNLFKFQGCLIPILFATIICLSKMVLICHSLPLGGSKLDSKRLMQCVYTHFLYPKWGGTRPIWHFLQLRSLRNRGLSLFILLCIYFLISLMLGKKCLITLCWFLPYNDVNQSRPRCFFLVSSLITAHFIFLSSPSLYNF